MNPPNVPPDYSTPEAREAYWDTIRKSDSYTIRHAPPPWDARSTPAPAPEAVPAGWTGFDEPAPKAIPDEGPKIAAAAPSEIRIVDASLRKLLEPTLVLRVAGSHGIDPATFEAAIKEAVIEVQRGNASGFAKRFRA